MRKLHTIGFTVGLWLLLISCQSKEQAQQVQRAVPVPVVEVPRRTVTGYTTYPVSIEGTISSGVRAKVSGYITEVLVDEGEEVQKGQPLFSLETQSLTEDAAAAKANVNAAQVEVDKLKPLVEKNIISEVQLKTAQAKLSQAKASYNSIVANIGYATINSPVNGVVGAIPYREGALVSPGDPTPLTTVSKVDEVYAFFAVNERDYLNLLQSTAGKDLSEKIDNFPPVELQLVNGASYDHKGEIETVTGQVDPSTGTVTFRAKFPNPNRLLTSGNSGTIRIPETYENVPVVPETSTFEQQGRVYVYRVRGDTLAVSTIIGVKDRVQNVVVISGGVKAGDKIVAQGIGKIGDNTLISPQPVAFDSIANTLKPVFK